MQRKRLPAESFPAYVEALTHDGRGLTHKEGKAVFIQGALPGEEVTFKYTHRHSKYDEGKIDEIINASPDRVVPACAHFGLCGGCTLQHLDVEKQIAFKQDWLLDNLVRIAKVEPEQILEPVMGSFWNYRRKARLGVKYVSKKGRVLVGFREYGRPYVTDLSRCEVLHPPVGVLLQELAQLIAELSIYNRLPQIEVAVGDAVVALSFRVLNPPNDQDRARLAAFGQRHHIWIYIQPGGPETLYLLWPEYKESLSYQLPEQHLIVEFEPYHFIQVNARINRQMVNTAIDLLDLQGHERVLDLFCGLGNFTLALARHTREVVGVEGDQRLLDKARRNAGRNGLSNIRFFSADLTGDISTQPWVPQNYDRVLLDPPRSGALEIMPQVAAWGAHRIVYVSCHPATLARDIGELVHRFGYRLLSAGVMDMFPHTVHVESMAVLGT